VAAAQALVQYGACVNDCVERSGCGMLHIAVEHGHMAMIRWLLSQADDSSLIGAVDTQYGVTALSIACAFK